MLLFSCNLKLILALSPTSKPPRVSHPGILCPKKERCVRFPPWGGNKVFPWRGLGHMRLNWFGSGVFHSSMRRFSWGSERLAAWHHPSPAPSNDDASRRAWRSASERRHPAAQMIKLGLGVGAYVGRKGKREAIKDCKLDKDEKIVMRLL